MPAGGQSVDGRAHAYRIGVVGAGLGGVALAVKLKLAGIEDFVVFEQSDGPGGTWHDNTYPGCQVDVPSEVYSYSFMPYDWTREYATQSELLKYINYVIDHFGIRSHFRFGSRVDEARWDNERSLYRVSVGVAAFDCNMVASCVGLLNVPKIPTWPGMTEFRGSLFHSARWDHSLELADRRVAVVGTGSSSAQIVPAIADVAREVVVYQREPGWVAPKPDRMFTSEERRRRRSPVRRKIRRWHGFIKHVETLGDRDVGSKRHRRLTQTCLEFIEREIPDPALRQLVTPAYPVGCKRLVRDSNYYKALSRPNVRLIPHAVERLTDTGIVDASGAENHFDVVVAAVGFHAADYLRSLSVVGPDGRSLREVWDGDPAAYLGITVPGFPNFFILYGPNTNGGGSIIAQHERQAELVVAAMRRMQRSRKSVVDTKASALSEFVAWVDRKNAVAFSAVHARCHNYFLSKSGRNVTQWPLGQLSYMFRTKMAVRAAFVYRDHA